MNLLVISRHDDLVERLRMAFEGAGHRVWHAQDPLAALANDAWDEAHVLLVDAKGDPMDGYRLCRLLRGESRILFSNLPIFLVLDHPPQEEDLQALQAVEGDGFIGSAYSIQQLLNHLGPVMAGAASHEAAPRVPILALGLHAALAQRARDLLQHFHMEIHTPPLRNAAQAQLALRAPVLLLGLSAGGVRRALDLLAQLRESGALPYTILLGQVKEEAVQRKLLLAGVSDWVGLPLSGPRLLHACKRAIEWAHVKRIQMEYESAIHDLRERRSML
jgi:DNA-binding response OmpR family regulator